MAKAAKAVEVEITERMANKFVKDIMERFENIESLRGKFMNGARKEKEAMTVIYEGTRPRAVSNSAEAWPKPKSRSSACSKKSKG